MHLSLASRDDRSGLTGSNLADEAAGFETSVNYSPAKIVERQTTSWQGLRAETAAVALPFSVHRPARRGGQSRARLRQHKIRAEAQPIARTSESVGCDRGTDGSWRLIGARGRRAADHNPGFGHSGSSLPPRWAEVASTNSGIYWFRPNISVTRIEFSLGFSNTCCA
jgi:hypothetical protein